MAKKPTVYDVAEQAGVSIATVSRALRKPESVRQATRESIETAVQQLGYVPSGSARSLAARKTGIIGLFLPNVDELETLSDFELTDHDTAEIHVDRPVTGRIHRDSLYFDHVLRGCELEAWSQGLSLMVSIGQGRGESDVNQMVHDMIGKVDGVIILARSVPDRLIESLVKRIPLVMVADAPIGGEKSMDLVRVSNRKGMCTLVEHLVDAHQIRSFIYMAGPDDSPDNHKRYVGFQEGLAARGISPESIPIYRGKFSRPTAKKITQDLIERGDLPQALVCANDQMALGALDALTQAGLRVPDDVIVTGFDGIEESDTSHPRLTTVRQPMVNLGRAAVSTVVKRIEHPDDPPYSTEMPVSVLLRESCEGVLEAIPAA
ncbi:LacI family DNA-binding transcriptional regulator [Bifidobacterium psychraerophilum]|uniref:LacI family transcriptional regulator n=1 Tax=Bifidobacterium psychraerophilum TaxID=218140 RepID=A0A087CHQ4_9BIFI|nr:LacI family DNA-binding transcriptional regulator [Bifidobacterium psychraerophilum]KFI82804.1 LacI family transcriptional regulator [Bifidobacterium psychraerophilum]MCI1659544.1 LacI family transcriptional regulator [Bifidobacterium psychraerophilum]MCI1804488.1 LacI family transcriptional regulator [Bifidobacterium psychraerophilum]MCI2176356.1 LacI family transcriptional regulator [Bifidobacterium psychraerophilum]MCI2181170.1 LacI family transcriptional regulator [Bifidobacterium psych